MSPESPPGSSGAGEPSAKRRKVTRACDRCKSRKRRCDGDQPCALCVSHKIACRYETPHLRGHSSDGPPPRQVPNTRHLGVPHEPRAPEHPLALDSRTALIAEELNANGINSRSSRAASPTGEGNAQPGHYLGPTSTFSFLRRAGRKFGRLAGERTPGEETDVSIFANGDVVVDGRDQAAIGFPADVTMRLLVRRYFDFAVPSHRFFHQQTVESWVCSLSDPSLRGDGNVQPVREAAIYLILATALLYKVDEHGNATGAVDSVAGAESEILRERYFQASQVKLQAEKGAARLESVQARLASVLYLLNTSRLNQAWYMLGTTYQLMVALGLHSSRSTVEAVGNCILQECRKRCYWVAFTVDTYFSVMLGRPPLMSELGVTQLLPNMANDENITVDSTQHGMKIRDSVQAAQVFHARLAKIIRDASNEQYLAHKASAEQQMETAQRLNYRINEWHQDLPVFLSGGIHPATLVPIFRRQLRVLQMAAAHATMIVNRPLILCYHSSADLIRPYVEQCLAAARRVLEMMLELVEQNHLFRAFWNFQYVTFHALSVVYVWIIQLKGPREEALRTQHDKQHLYDLSEKVQTHLAEATQLNAPNLRYSVILEELRREALRALSRQTQAVRQVETAPTSNGGGFVDTPDQGAPLSISSDWDSMLDFGTDPELWLQLDSFPFEEFGVPAGEAPFGM